MMNRRPPDLERTTPGRKALAPFLFALLVSIYLFSSSDRALYTDASLVRYEVTRSMVERFDCDIPYSWGVKGVDGRDYSWFGIGQSVLAIPFYLAGKLLGAPENAVALMNTLLGAAAAVLIFFFTRALGSTDRASLLTALFYGLGTFAFPFAKHPFDHTTETFFVLLSVYFMYLHTLEKTTSKLILSSLALGVAFITRYTSILAVPSLFLLVLVSYWREHGRLSAMRRAALDGLIFGVAFLPFLLLALWYNYYRFGSVFETGYSLIAAKIGLDFFSGTPLLIGLEGFLVSPGKGFFYYSPIAILFFFSVRSFAKKHPGPAVAFVGVIVSYVLFLSRNVFWHGDWAWGPRYLLAVTPFFIIPVSLIIDSDRWQKRASFRMLVYLIFAISVVIQMAAVSVDFQKYFQNMAQVEKVSFIVVGDKGIPCVSEPPFETYFDWHRSPILAQFKFIGQFAAGLRSYKYSKPPGDAPFSETIKHEPHMNLFDFWWLYKYYMEGTYSGVLAAIGLLFMAAYSGGRLWMSLKDSCK